MQFSVSQSSWSPTWLGSFIESLFYSQSSHPQNNHYRELQPPLHLDWPNENRRQDRQRQVRDNRYGREEEADGAVELRIADANARAPQSIYRVADVTDCDDEDDRRAELQRDQAPERVGEPAAAIGDAHQADADTALDGHSASGVEEFGNVKELEGKTSK